MAAPADFPEKNTTFRSDTPGVGDLPVYRGDDGVVISKWAVSDAELAEIIRTRSVWLLVAGAVYPTMVAGVSPFKTDRLLHKAVVQERRRRGSVVPFGRRVGRAVRTTLPHRPWGKKK